MGGRADEESDDAATPSFVGIAFEVWEALSADASKMETILDSGSSLVISGNIGDFYQIEPVATERIHGVGGRMNGGQPIGHEGLLKPNNLGLETGVYIPDFLPSKRLISTQVLLRDGWEVSLKNDGTSLLRHQIRNKAIPVWYERGLARFDFRIGPDYEHEALLSEETAIELEGMEPSFENPKPPGGGKKLTDLGKLRRLKVDAALELHQRIAHLNVPGNHVECPECLASKGQRQDVKRVREPEFKVSGPFEQLNADFLGEIKPLSKDGRKYLFVVIDDASAYLWITPTSDKTGCYQAIKDVLEEVAKRDTAYEGQRIIKRVRTDNDKVIRGKPWIEALATREVEAMHSTP